ncbi:MAG: LexA family transcriptional regulator [Clostridiales bacterium]|nr:LexA family transcriptional regulator [Clostridiales bacterium]
MDKHSTYRLIRDWKLNESIEKARRDSRVSRSQLAARLDLTLGGVSAWEYGRTRPDIENIRRLCCALNVSADELLGIRTGRETLSAQQKELMDIMVKLPERECAYLLSLAQTMLSAQNAQANVMDINEARKQVRLVSLPLNPLSMCAGDGLFLDDGGESETMQLVYSPILDDCDELVRVSGRSMEPEYFDGDIALVQHTDTLGEGEIGVFVLDGEGIMKEYRKDGLYPLNPEYEVIRPDENSTLRCFGRVLGKVTEKMLP